MILGMPLVSMTSGDHLRERFMVMLHEPWENASSRTGYTVENSILMPVSSIRSPSFSKYALGPMGSAFTTG